MGPQDNAAAALRVLIVDDEALARARLRSLLAQIDEPAVIVAGEAAGAEAAFERARQGDVDLLLLDVQMPGVRSRTAGLDLAARLATLSPPPAVVFVTAHAEHAVTAFELAADDYLTKPVRADRLQAALRRVAQRRLPTSPASTPVTDEPMLVVSDRGRLLRVPLAEVLYLKAELKYVTLRTAERSMVLDDALADLEQRVGPGFIRVHRNALVARAAVRELQRRTGSVDGDAWAVRVASVDEWLAVSRRQIAAVRAALSSADGGLR